MADDRTACATAGRPAGNQAAEEHFQNLRRIGDRPPYQGSTTVLDPRKET